MKKSLWPLAFVFLSFLSACSTINDAQKLATAGAQASTKLQASSTAVYNGFLEGPKLDALDQAYATNGEQPITTMPIGTYNKIRDALKARIDVATSLVSVYASFGKLASSTAQSDTDTALSGLSDSVSKLSVALNGKAIPASTASIIGEGGGLIAMLAQRDAILATNDQIISALNSYHDLLAKSENRQAIVSLSKDAIGYRFEVLKVFWKRGLMTGNQTALTNVIAESGMSFKLAGKPDDFSANSPAFNKAMLAYLEFAKSDQAAAVEDEYDANLKLVEGLLKQHTSIKNDTALDFTEIGALATRLQAIADLLQKEAKLKTGS